VSRNQVTGAVWSLFLFVAPASAYDVVVDTLDTTIPGQQPGFTVPYVFHTELLETGFGFARVKQGQWQPQDSLVFTAYGTTNKSWGVAGSLRRARFGESRWFVSPMFYVQRNTAQRFYSELGFGVDETQGGSNNSDVNDFFQGRGWNVYGDAEFRYVMPIGLGRDQIIHQFDTDGGILTGGSSHGPWNPMDSGRTMLVLKPFFMWRTLVVDENNIGQFPPFSPVTLGEEEEGISNGLIANLEYDNRDFRVNPERGSYQKLGITRDFGWFNSSNSWTSLDADLRKYFSLGSSENFRQKVLALNVWTAYVPTWDLTKIGNAYRIDNAPPENMGATLGGSHRLRGYPRGRFSDKAAIYYSAELRVIPEWNAVQSWPLIRNLPWRWWQVAGFAEIGRVAPSWDISELHHDMKWSAGVSLRAMIGSGLGRLDIAKSEESTQVIVMVNQPF
jgi:hypothetical protein